MVVDEFRTTVGMRVRGQSLPRVRGDVVDVEFATQVVARPGLRVDVFAEGVKAAVSFVVANLVTASWSRAAATTYRGERGLT